MPRSRAPLAVLASGMLWFLGTGTRPLWPLAWLAPLPLLLALPALPPRRAALAGLAASAIGALELALAYRGLPPLLRVGIVLLAAVPGAAVAWAWRVLDARLPAAASALAYPALVVAVELAVARLSPHGTFGSLAYSQADVLPLVQVASLAGTAGIAFLVSLPAAALAVAWHRRATRRAAWSALAVAVGVLAPALAFGALRLRAPAPGASIRVGLATSDSSAIHFGATDSLEALSVVRQWAARVERLADAGARVIVLPEKFVGVTPAYADAARRTLADVARRRGVTVVAGLNALDPRGAGASRNSAVVFDDSGRVALDYAKVHLIAGLEQGYRPGPGAGSFPLSGRRVGVAICKDLDFPALGREHARAAVALLLVPAWDFVADGWLHSRMAILRGVEGGYPMVRSATEGRLTVTDPYGRVVAERVSSEAPEVTLVAAAPVGGVATVYGRWGDWFAVLCALGCVAGALVAARGTARRRAR